MRVEIHCTRCAASVIVLNVANEANQMQQLKTNGWKSKPAICPDCQ